jgi:hypothetical protein
VFKNAFEGLYRCPIGQFLPKISYLGKNTLSGLMTSYPGAKVVRNMSVCLNAIIEIVNRRNLANICT